MVGARRRPPSEAVRDPERCSGGNLRVGLEYSLFIGKGELAMSNAQQVRRIREIVERLGLTVATPAEARERLGLKGGDKVAF